MRTILLCLLLMQAYNICFAQMVIEPIEFEVDQEDIPYSRMDSDSLYLLRSGNGVITCENYEPVNSGGIPVSNNILLPINQVRSTNLLFVKSPADYKPGELIYIRSFNLLTKYNYETYLKQSNLLYAPPGDTESTQKTATTIKTYKGSHCLVRIADLHITYNIAYITETDGKLPGNGSRQYVMMAPVVGEKKKKKKMR